jgi:SAM-dependent methyltransferase
MTDPVTLYPANLLRRNFARAADGLSGRWIIHNEIARRLTEKLADMRRPFDTVLDLGSGTATFAEHLADAGLTPRALVHADLTPEALRHPLSVAVNAEHPLPFANGTFDLILSNLMLHWLNDVPQALMHMGRTLKPDGLLLASTLGQDSLHEVRTAFADAGLPHPRTIPLPDVQKAGAALQKVGFALPVVDRDVLTITYRSFADMYTDLRQTGSRNLHPNRARGLLTPRQLARMESAYRANFARPDGTLPLTLEIIYLHGWRPHASQPKPLKPGSATVGLDEVLATLRTTPKG